MDLKVLNDDLLDMTSRQLSLDYACGTGDFFGSVNRVTKSRITEGCRKLSDGAEFFKMATMGRAVIASVSDDILGFMTDLFGRFSKSDPAVLFDGTQMYAISKKLSQYNMTAAQTKIYYLPETPYRYISKTGFDIRVFEGDEIASTLYQYKGFSNALIYATDGVRRDMTAVAAVNGRNVIGIAGASNDSENFWQIGIDVLPEFREKGLASELVSALAKEVFRRGAVPYYGTWGGNIASQNVANKSGFYPAWSELTAFSVGDGI